MIIMAMRNKHDIDLGMLFSEMPGSVSRFAVPMRVAHTGSVTMVIPFSWITNVECPTQESNVRKRFV